MPKRKSSDEFDLEQSTEPSPAVEGITGGTQPSAQGAETFEDTAYVKPQADSAGARETITIRLDESGKIDLAGMRNKTIGKLKAAVSATPDLFPSGGGGGSIPTVSLPDAAIDAIYNVIGALETWAASTRYPADISAAVFRYTDAELEVLRKPTNDVIKLYAGRFMQHPEITTLALVLTQIHFDKLRSLQIMTAQRGGA